MSSAETLNFGPQWLRDLSEGSANSATGIPSQTPQAPSKFKLAEYRYGREEMLALFVEESEVPDELHRAPSLVSEIIQIPLALRSASDHPQGQLPSFRGRGGMSSGLRGRSITSRGRGRGRGSAWADHDDGPLRRPPLRRSESEDWRSDSLRGKGDGAEDIMNGLKEWRVSGPRGGGDLWKDTWRDRQDEMKEPRYPRGRSLSSRDAEDADRRWRDDEINGLNGKEIENLGLQDKNQGVEAKEKDKDPPEDPTSLVLSSVPEAENKLNSGTESDTHQFAPVDSNEKLERRLDPVQEHHEDIDTGKEQTAASHQSSEMADSVLKTVDPNPLEEMFRKLTADDKSSDAIHNITGRSALEQEFQVSKSELIGGKGDTEPMQTSVFSDSSLAVTPQSPMAQLQSLATTWHYKDPQGDIQGPFSANQMLEWYHAGYFSMGLLVKRSCDSDFVPLGKLIERWGQIPFTASLQKNPFTVNQSLATVTTGQQMQSMKFVQEQQVQSHVQTQAPIGRTQQQNNLQVIYENLLKNPEFCRLPPQQRQLVVMQYAEDLKRQSLATEVSRAQSFPDSRNLHGGTSEASIVQADSLLHQKMLEEARRKEEEKIRMIQKQQEEQKQLLRQQEEEFRRKKEMLMMEQEEIEKMQQEARRKKEQLQREMEEDLKRKKLQEMQELEQRRKKEEEERRRQKEELERRLAEERRIQEEAEERRRMEEERKRLEEEARKLEMQRQEELRRIEIEREEQRMAEERKRQEERDRELAREAEMQRRAEVIRLQKEKEEAAKSLIRKQQQEKQMQQIQLPSHAKWGHGQPIQGRNESLSLIEIQKLEKEQEKSRMEEEARMAREIRNQPIKPKTGWGSAARDTEGMSLLDIQREEAKEMSKTKQTVPIVKPEVAKPANFGSSWSKPPKIQPDVPRPRPKQPASFWDQVVEENPPKKQVVTIKPSLPSQQPTKQPKQQKGAKQKPKGDERQQVKALFQQQISKDRFTEWCENYLKKMNVGSIDIPTFVNFLRDVESPYEVQEYVQSYLGESKEARDFTSLFLEQRAKLGTPHELSTQVTSKPQAAAACDTDGFEMVTSNTKRGKKKLKKLQKVDPSILGFSVNAASDRVNMGEIQTADD